ncbi:MAG: replication-associated recombination protein A [bacterium]|nr:replication-associated recombination protein A [bacterium]
MDAPSLFGDRDATTGATTAAPLAARMRPRTLDEFVGQAHLVGQARVLRRAIESDDVPSLILWGPPGTGKTTLAEIVAGATGAHFVALSAVSAGVADLRRVVADARRLRAAGKRTVLFIDEIHRFNKAQQDAVLPYVEDGTVTLIGATTENPSFEVNSALLSRARVYVLHPLSDEEIGVIVDRTMAEPERGLGAMGLALANDARAALLNMANGDARVALGGLELAASGVRGERRTTIELNDIAEALQRRAAIYDKGGEAHYDVISAFIKSLRGSDPDAALYWLARMIDGGEDPLFIVRRMVILAAEDVGLADPRALQIAVACQQAVHFVGYPEGYLPMAECAIYLATAPKSNSVIASYGRAMADVQATRNDSVPLHLRNAPTSLMRSMEYGKGYIYAHDAYAGMASAGQESPPAERLQAYLPENLKDRRYYEPGLQGEEARLAEWIRERRSK